MKWLENIRKKNELNRKRAIQKELLADLKYMRENKNTGLLTRRLFDMKGVAWAQTQTGWTDYVDVRMSDGYEITTRGVHLSKVIREAAVEIALRWRSLLRESQ